MWAWHELFAIEPDRDGGIGNSEVPLRSWRLARDENPTRIKTVAQRRAWVRQTRLSDRVVAWVPGKVEGNNVSLGDSDVGRDELEDTTGFCRSAADLYNCILSPGEKRYSQCEERCKRMHCSRGSKVYVCMPRQKCLLISKWRKELRLTRRSKITAASDHTRNIPLTLWGGSAGV